MDHLPEIKRELENLNKQQVHDICTEINQIELADNMIWLMELLKIYQEE